MNKLSLSDITIRIGDRNICESLKMEFSSGERWGILGANGAGKTTFLLTLLGLHPCKKGSIRFNQTSLMSLPAKIRAQKIGMLFQEFTPMFPQRVWEYCANSCYPYWSPFKCDQTQDEKRIKEILNIVELDHFIHKRINQLSGGEKKRLAIASLLIQSPQIYLLDEPTNHLDIRHQSKLLNFFSNLAHAEKKTIIMSVHDMNIAEQYCDYVILLFDDIFLYGRVDDLFTEKYLSRLYKHAIQRKLQPTWIAN